MNDYIYHNTTKIIFGRSAEKYIGSECKALADGGKVLLLLGGGSVKKSGLYDKVVASLNESGVEFTELWGVQPNPRIDKVREAAMTAKRENVSLILAVGGGSVIDTAKAVAIMATNDGDWWDYIHGGTGGGKRMANAGLPIVAIPTTAGTGTEADPFTVITNGEEKIGGGGEKCFPTISIVDPDFMMTVPPHLTAYQGFDAFFHAAEGYLAKTASPMSDMFALQAIALIGKSLATAVKDGGNADARADVALANTLAGFVETLSSCSGEHAIEHALSAFHPDLPHGAGLIMLSKAYWSRFKDTSADRLQAIAHALGRADGDFLAALAELQQACGVDKLRLSDYGVKPEDAGELADNAASTMGALFRVDPRTLSREEIMDIITESI